MCWYSVLVIFCIDLFFGAKGSIIYGCTDTVWSTVCVCKLFSVNDFSGNTCTAPKILKFGTNIEFMTCIV